MTMLSHDFLLCSPWLQVGRRSKQIFRWHTPLTRPSTSTSMFLNLSCIPRPWISTMHSLTSSNTPVSCLSGIRTRHCKCRKTNLQIWLHHCSRITWPSRARFTPCQGALSSKPKGWHHNGWAPEPPSKCKLVSLILSNLWLNLVVENFSQWPTNMPISNNIRQSQQLNLSSSTSISFLSSLKLLKCACSACCLTPRIPSWDTLATRQLPPQWVHQYQRV